MLYALRGYLLRAIGGENKDYTEYSILQCMEWSEEAFTPT